MLVRLLIVPVNFKKLFYLIIEIIERRLKYD